MTSPLAFAKTDEDKFLESATTRALDGAAAAQDSLKQAQAAAERQAADEENATAAYLNRFAQP